MSSKSGNVGIRLAIAKNKCAWASDTWHVRWGPYSVQRFAERRLSNTCSKTFKRATDIQTNKVCNQIKNTWLCLNIKILPPDCLDRELLCLCCTEHWELETQSAWSWCLQCVEAVLHATGVAALWGLRWTDLGQWGLELSVFAHQQFAKSYFIKIPSIVYGYIKTWRSRHTKVVKYWAKVKIGSTNNEWRVRANSSVTKRSDDTRQRPSSRKRSFSRSTPGTSDCTSQPSPIWGQAIKFIRLQLNFAI